jgi:hypothetical protein
MYIPYLGKKGTESGKGGGARGRTQSKEHGQDKEADGKKMKKRSSLLS